MKKILHIIQSLDSGGCENFLLRVLPRLKNFDQQILTLKSRGELADSFEGKGVKVECLKKNWPSLVRRVRESNPDVVLTYLFHADLLGRIYLGLFTKYKPIPYLRTTYNFPKYKWVRLFEKLTSFMVPRYLANSNSVKYFYTNKLGINAQKIAVIPNGIDIKTFNLPEGARESFRNEMGIKNNDLVIACVANFHPNKGHKYLLEAFKRICRKRKNVWLWLAGDGEEKENLVKIIERSFFKEKVVFFGKRNDVPLVLGSSDIFALPTLFEGMSNAVIEAMASGLPVVTTNIPENREIIENGKTGLLVPAKSISCLVNSLDELIGNKQLRDLLGKFAYKQILDKYDIVKIVKKLKSFLINI